MKWLKCSNKGSDIVCNAIVKKRFFKYYFGNSGVKVSQLNLGSSGGKKTFNVC